MKEQRGAQYSIRNYTIYFAFVISALLIWEWLIRVGQISPLFFPPPSDIARTLIMMLEDGELFLHLRATTVRLISGLIVGGLWGLILGWLMGWSRDLSKFVDPIIAALHPIPKISILPLFMILFGIGEASKVIVIAVAAFFPMLINTMAGVRQINSLHFDVATSFSANRLQIFRKIIFPGSLPLVLVGIRLSANAALLLTIAVELITAQNGLGAVIWLSWQTLRIESLYISLLIIALMGIGLNVLFQYLAKTLAPWQAS